MTTGMNPLRLSSMMRSMARTASSSLSSRSKRSLTLKTALSGSAWNRWSRPSIRTTSRGWPPPSPRPKLIYIDLSFLSLLLFLLYYFYQIKCLTLIIPRLILLILLQSQKLASILNYKIFLIIFGKYIALVLRFLVILIYQNLVLGYLLLRRNIATF